MAYQTYYILSERVAGNDKLLRLTVYEPLADHTETKICTALGEVVGRVMMRPMADRKLEAQHWQQWSDEEYRVIRAAYDDTPITRHLWWHEIPDNGLMTPRWFVTNLNVGATK